MPCHAPHGNGRELHVHARSPDGRTPLVEDQTRVSSTRRRPGCAKLWPNASWFLTTSALTHTLSILFDIFIASLSIEVVGFNQHGKIRIIYSRHRCNRNNFDRRRAERAIRGAATSRSRHACGQSVVFLSRDRHDRSHPVLPRTCCPRNPRLNARASREPRLMASPRKRPPTLLMASMLKLE